MAPSNDVLAFPRSGSLTLRVLGGRWPTDSQERKRGQQRKSVLPWTSSDSAAFARASTTAPTGEGRADGIARASVVGVELHIHPDVGVCSIRYDELIPVLLLRRQHGYATQPAPGLWMDDLQERTQNDVRFGPGMSLRKWSPISRGRSSRPMTLIGPGSSGRPRFPVHGDFLANLVGPFLVAGAGTAFSFIPISVAALAGVTEHESGLASGLLNTSMQIGGAIGTAIASSVAASGTNTPPCARETR